MFFTLKLKPFIRNFILGFHTILLHVYIDDLRNISHFPDALKIQIRLTVITAIPPSTIVLMDIFAAVKN